MREVEVLPHNLVIGYSLRDVSLPAFMAAPTQAEQVPGAKLLSKNCRREQFQIGPIATEKIWGEGGKGAHIQQHLQSFHIEHQATFLD